MRYVVIDFHHNHWRVSYITITHQMMRTDIRNVIIVTTTKNQNSSFPASKAKKDKLNNFWATFGCSNGFGYNRYDLKCFGYTQEIFVNRLMSMSDCWRRWPKLQTQCGLFRCGSETCPLFSFSFFLFVFCYKVYTFPCQMHFSFPSVRVECVQHL